MTLVSGGSIEQKTQHTALRRADVGTEGCEDMETDSDSLYMERKVSDSLANGNRESNVQKIYCQSVQDFGVQGRAKVNIEQPCRVLLLPGRRQCCESL